MKVPMTSIKGIFFTLFLFLILDASAFEIAQLDTNKKLIDKGKIKLAMAKARKTYLEGDIRGALTQYRNVLVDDKKYAMAHFRIAECHYDLHNYKSALEAADKAKGFDPEVHKELNYVYGRIYHRTGKLDEAIGAFKAFKTVMTNENQIKNFPVDQYIEQCERAKQMIKNPVNVKLQNLGKGINSRHDDYGLVLAPDGKTMYFNSRRPDTEGGGKAVDFKYYSDVYQVKWNEETNAWGEVEKLPGKVNSQAFDDVTCLSADGTEMYLTLNILGFTKSSDVAVSRLGKSGKWGLPKRLGKTINSSYFESSATLSKDGNSLYFVSEKVTDGLGHSDIYRVNKISKKEWGEPTSLGPIINTPEDENTAFIHPDGNLLIFSSNGHDSMGGYDLFYSVKENGQWSKPQNMGYPINTVGDDLHFVLAADGQKGYFSAVQDKGIGGRDIIEVDLSKHPLFAK